MKNLNTKLTVLHDDNGTFEDHSNSAHSFIRDSFVLDYTLTDDTFYIGYRKPINTFYTELSVLNTTAAAVTIDYYQAGTINAFTALTTVIDDTLGLTRSGFTQWERDPTDEDVTTINGVEQYWYRLNWDATLLATTAIRGLNIVFSDDQDLRAVVPSVTTTKFLADGETSHILSHVAARDYIMQRLSLDGKLKANFSSGILSELNQFDILNIEQLRNASKYKALNILFEDLSDDPEDNFAKRALMFNGQFENIYTHLTFLDVDVDDDGKSDRYEEMNSASSELVRR